jgi:hypothetical protein
MIITESFVWINYPKTASTFVRLALREIYRIPKHDVFKRLRMRGRWMEELLLPENRARVGDRSGAPTPHGTRRQIPFQHRGKPVISAIRCPVDRCLSLYRYNDWKSADQKPASANEIARLFPSYPDLSFDRFVEYMIHFYSGILEIGGNDYKLGPQSADFLAFFSHASNQATGKFVFETWEQLESTLQGVLFLDAKNMNSELFGRLVTLGYAPGSVRCILAMKPANESSSKEDRFVVSDSTREKINRAEWLLNAWLIRTVAGSTVDLSKEAANATASEARGATGL